MKTKKILYSALTVLPVILIGYVLFFSPIHVFGRSLNLFELKQQRDLEALAAADIAYPLTDLTMIMSDSGYGPLEINMENGDEEPGDGGPIRLRGQTFSSGIGVHATSVISYDLQGKCSTFTSFIGVDDSIEVWVGSVTFQLYGDGVKIFEHGPMQSDNYDGQPYPPHSTGLVDVTGVHEFVLVVTTGGNHHYQDKANWAQPVITCSSLPNGDGTSFKHIRGSWEPVMPWPVKAIHSSLLPSGHILSHASGDETSIANDDWENGQPPTYNMTKVDLADINTWSHEWVNNNTQEMYCSAHTLLPDGRVFEFGGHDGNGGVIDNIYGKDQASIFDFDTKTWEPQQSMSQARWYPTAVTLGNGEVMAIGGIHGTAAEEANIFKPEIFNGSEWRTLNNVDYSGRLLANDAIFQHTYPYVHLVSDGRVFWSGWDKEMAYIDLTGNGQWGQIHTREDIFRNWAAPIMYRQDKIMLIGGIAPHVDGNPNQMNAFGYATNTVQLIDLTGDTPDSRRTNSMIYTRADADGTLLANGEVFINGGNAYHLLGDNPTKIFVPEIWNPNTEEWRLAAQADKPRGYHSSSLLLPDGRVWTAGGECGDDCTDGMTAQVYNPPYLFKQDGSGEFATRPVLESVDEQISYAKPFSATVSSNNGVSKVNLIRLGSTTHHFNFEQRFIELDYQKDGDSLTLQAPAHGNLAPPGFYMLFVLDDNGVPAIAKNVQILPEEESVWQTVESSDESAPTARHESAYVEYDGKFYLMGGRGNRPTEMFDPATKKWTSVGTPPLQFHHLQPVAYDDKIYVVSGFVGEYPNETSLENIYIFDPSDNSWATGPAIPEARRRGSAGVAVYNGKIYLIGGNNKGHNGGFQPWFDVFDPVTNQWAELDDAPRARDHFSAAVIGNKLYLAGGRQTDLPNGPFDNTLPEVDIYDFSTASWSTLVNNLPTERAGAASLPHGKDLIVVGGESAAQYPSHAQAEMLDTNTGVWSSLPNMITGRHSGGAVIWNDTVYAVSGSGNQGGWPELNSQESLELDPAEAADTSLTGKILREAWTGISGNQIADLTGAAKFSGQPDLTELLTSFETPQNWSDNYGQQVRGYVHPPTTGLYEFWIASDDEAALYLSTDSNPENKVQIANMPDFADFRHFDKYPSQQSAMIMLEAGRKYYIEAIHKDGTGNDHLSVAWKAPGSSQEVIPGAYLSPFISIPVKHDLVITITPTATPTATPVGTPTPTTTPTPTATPSPTGTVTPPAGNISIYLPLITR